MNLVVLIGNLGADPESRQTNSGKAVCNFSVATSRKVGGEEQTEWHKIVAWEKTAELCQQYLKRGRKVCVQGSLRQRSWEQDGTTRYSTEIHAFSVEFLSPAPPQQQQGGYGQQQPGGYGAPAQGQQQQQRGYYPPQQPPPPPQQQQTQSYGQQQPPPPPQQQQTQSYGQQQPPPQQQGGYYQDTSDLPF
jgi:single-strand DNA-binding protein